MSLLPFFFPSFLPSFLFRHLNTTLVPRWLTVIPQCLEYSLTRNAVDEKEMCLCKQSWVHTHAETLMGTSMHLNTHIYTSVMWRKQTMDGVFNIHESVALRHTSNCVSKLLIHSLSEWLQLRGSYSKPSHPTTQSTVLEVSNFAQFTKDL